MDVDSAGLEVLSAQECLELAATVPVGRVVFTDQALPAILPLNFVLDDGAVIIRTAAGSRLAAAVRDAVVAFEVDQVDPVHSTGWSVTITGRANAVTEPDELRRLAGRLQPWAPGRGDRFIRIPAERVTGRRLPGSPALPAAGRRR